MTRLMTLADVGLGGAEYQMRFENPEQLRACVLHLLEETHGHHFAVVGEGTTLLMSKMAVTCLRDAGLLTVLEDHDV